MVVEKIHDREKELVKTMFERLRSVPKLHILADTIQERLAIFSFYFETIHYNLVVKLLNDRFYAVHFNFHDSRTFTLNGEEFSEDEAAKFLKKMKIEDSTFNIVGEESVQTSLNAGIISEYQIKKIEGIPFALVFI